MQGVPSCTTVDCELKPQTGLDWDCPGEDDQTLPGYFNDTCTVSCSFGYFTLLSNGEQCNAADEEKAERCTVNARCMFLEDPGTGRVDPSRSIEFASTVCEVPAEIQLKNFAEMGFEEEADYMWTSFPDANTQEACLSKVGSTAVWQGKGAASCVHPKSSSSCTPAEDVTGLRGTVLYVVFAGVDDEEGCWGYGTFYGIENERAHKPHDGIGEGSAAAVPPIRRAWYLCPVSETIRNPLDDQSTGSNVSWKFMGREPIDGEMVHRSFTCVLDTCSDVENCPGLNAIEDCYRPCDPGQAPGGKLALAGTDEQVQCRDRKPVLVNACKPLDCKSPVDFPGVLTVGTYAGSAYDVEEIQSSQECEGTDIPDGTTCMVNCMRLHYFFDNAYDGTLSGSATYPRSLPFTCKAGNFQIAIDPTAGLTPVASSPTGVLGGEYQCLLEGSTAQTVPAVTATLGLQMSTADVQMLLENQEVAIAAIEDGLTRV